MLSLATYLNALKDVNIVAIYALHSLIEIVYEDALGRNRRLAKRQQATDKCFGAWKSI